MCASIRSQLMLATSPLLRWPRSVRKSGPMPSVDPQASESALTASDKSMILCKDRLTALTCCFHTISAVCLRKRLAKRVRSITAHVDADQ